MADIGSIELDAKIDTSQYEAGAATVENTNERIKSSTKSVGDSQDEASKKSGGFSKAFSAGWGAVAGIASSVTGKVIDSVGGLVGEMVDASDSANKFSSTLKFAGVDDSKIKALTDSTQKYADQTVFSLGDIRNATAQLAANGVPNYDKLAEAAGNLTAVAGGGANEFKSVSMALTQTAAAGKLTTENWNQLSDAIPGASGKLQEAMLKNGAYTGDFREAMAKGEITANEFNQALLGLGLSDTAEEAAKSTQTFDGALDNLQASVVKAGSALLDVFKPAVTGAMSTVADSITNVVSFFQSNGGKIQATASEIGSSFMSTFTAAFDPASIQSAFDNALEPLSNAWTRIEPMLAPIAGNVGTSMGNVTQGFSNAFGGLIEGVSKVIGAVAPYIAQFMEIWTSLQEAVSPIITQLGTIIGELFDKIGGMIADIVNTVGPPLMQFINQIVDIVQDNMPTIQAIIDQIGEAIDQLVPVIQQIITTVVDTLMPAIQPLFDAISDFLSSVIPPLLDGIKKVIPIFVNLAETIISNVQPVIEGITNAIKGVIEVLTGIITFITGVFTGNWSKAWDGIKQIFGGIWDAIKGLVSAAINAVSGVISNVVNGIKSFWNGAWNGIKSFFGNIWEGMKRAAQNGVNGVIGFVKGLPDRVKSFFSNAGSWLLNAGKAILDGLLSGLKNAWKNVTSFVGGIGDWIKEHKGPISYDRKLLVPAGNAIMGGLNEGLQDSFGDVKDTVSDITGLFDPINDVDAQANVSAVNSMASSVTPAPTVSTATRSYDTGTNGIGSSGTVDMEALSLVMANALSGKKWVLTTTGRDLAIAMIDDIDEELALKADREA